MMFPSICPATFQICSYFWMILTTLHYPQMRQWCRASLTKVQQTIKETRQLRNGLVVYTCSLVDCLAGEGALILCATGSRPGTVFCATASILNACTTVDVVLLWLKSDDNLVALPFFIFDELQKCSMTDFGVISLQSTDECAVSQLIDLFVLMSTVATLCQWRCTIRAKLQDVADLSFRCDVELVTNKQFCLLITTPAGRVFHSDRHRPIVTQLSYVVFVLCPCYRNWRPYNLYAGCCSSFTMRFDLGRYLSRN